eukprot:PITA_29025
MYNDESVANYFLRVDEIVNCMKNLGEEIKEVVVVEKVIRSLSPRFESKVSTIEEKENLQNLKMSQLHEILTAYEMRKGGPSDRREATFKASSKGEYYESGNVSEEEEESNFVRNIQQGTGRFRGKLPFKCFACGRVGHYAAKCPHKDKIDKGKEPVRWNKKQNANKKSYYTHEDSDGFSNSDEDERGNNYKLLMAFEDDDYMDAIDEEGIYEEISKLKVYLEEKNMIIDSLQCQLAEREKHHEKLECEIVGLRKEIEKTKALNLKFVEGSETLDEIINVQCSPLIKIGLGYNGEASKASTSKSYLDAARRSEQRPNRNYQEQVSTDKGTSLKHQNMENKETTTKKMWDSFLYRRTGKPIVHRQWMFKSYDSHMCDQGTEVIFRSNGCSVRDLDTGKTVIKGKRTPNNLYIFEEGQQQCYLSKDDEHWLWHRRLGHVSFSQIRKACKYQAVCGLPDIKIPDSTICKSCQFGKQTRTNFPEKEGSASRPLELVHTDVCGPFRTRSPRGEEYFILFIDDFSRMVWLGFMKHKDEAFEKFKSFKVLVEKESDHKIKCLRSDRGGEFTSNEFFDFCEEDGIRREFSTTRTPQQNGVVERMNIIVQQMARAMLDESGTPATFWGEAAFAVVFILNKTNVRVNSTQTPHEIWYGETPSVKHFKIFGSRCYIRNNDEQLGKLEPRVDEGILLGYSPHRKAYKCYNKRLGRIVDSIDVVVDEKGYIPRQVDNENIEEDADYSPNQTDDE